VSWIQQHRREIALLSILMLALLLRLWGLGAVALIGDESYYWLWSKHLALSYLDHPAGTALMVRLSTALGGESEAGVRWFNAVLGAAAVWLAYTVGAQLLSPLAGLIAAACLAVGPPYLVTSRFVYTDALQLALLLANLSLLVPFLRQGPSAAIAGWRFVAVGLSMAALLNTKYSAYLYAVVIVVTLAWQRRDLFADRRTWWAIAIALVGCVPALVWNAAHDWASYRWQWQHLTRPSGQAYQPLGHLGHAILYLTPPLLALSVPSVAGTWRRPHAWLFLAGVVMTIPALLSPANSPRNAAVGLALLLLVSAEELACWLRGRWRLIATCSVSLLLALNTLYGLGTVLATHAVDLLPHSSVASALRWEGAGWREIGLDPEGTLGLKREWPLFALDYSIAGQLRYYVRLPVTTGWAQYRFWAGPQICVEPGADAVQVVGLAYLDPTVVTERLQESFRQIDGPRRVAVGVSGTEKVFYLWQAEGCMVTAEMFLERLDFLQLAQAGRGG
jgi:4-amino-4-deoxy-L-arabinose transferase-like glycosyltransferase